MTDVSAVPVSSEPLPTTAPVAAASVAVPVPTSVVKPKSVVVSAVSLPVELGIAGFGGIIAGLGSFTGALTVAGASDLNSLKAAGIGGGFTALVFFTNSIRNWYGQKYGTPVA
jgi:hypothetical protein